MKICFLKYIPVTLVCLFILISSVYSQENLITKVKKISRPEKYWAITHPFVANAAYKITLKVRKVVSEIAKDSTLDHDGNGGQVDAFRHTLWMAYLCQKINWKKAYKLGIAHEKGDKIDFENHRISDEGIQDSISSAMDLYNNNIGIEIGRKHNNVSENELIEIVKKAVLEGITKKIKKDRKGESLDSNNNIINKKEWQGYWVNKRCLVNSNYNNP
ncbi:MAG: hypothetical protein Q8880_01945 [Bacteroidota bacterium]|nr:hypothetical protein [Bacteroidota bacterium]